MNKHIAVILAGCGHQMGSSAEDTVLTLLQLDHAGVQSQCFAPEQAHIPPANLPSPTSLPLADAAKLTRQPVLPLNDETQAKHFDGIIIPGGRGVLSVFSNLDQPDATPELQDELADFLASAHQNDIPIATIGLATLLLPIAFGEGITCTLGQEAAMLGTLMHLGGLHRHCEADDIVIDHAQKLLSTPGTLEAEHLSHAAKGIHCLVDRLLELSN
ncbi:hypothetical protein BFW38_12370 [Terasakiispira papahanaumokuakeensis]|uniref:Isoprenoid biosynthesis protein ElbB n=1 Tax=Terasakiispira papahanaumokuakeensis TaxID=197479 RepID=A0A1E2VC11_9GAMM|nr:hypothetical protein [Terasakiispira papahanaumokuakeensis]ODC04205.1 hypothetical protein BFW38_12370 [Terasakiispira papahanaumokuakeensis]